jgi:glycosyltransferase involved in cell wall biosynthesis
MNILLLDQYSDPGGAQQILVELLPAIRERGWRVLVGLPGSGKLFDAVRAQGVEAVRIDCWASPAGKIQFASKTVQLARQIRTLVEQADANLVYLNGPRLVPAAALARPRCPVVFHSHSFLPEGPARTITGLGLQSLNARVVANCRFVADQWKRFVRPERIGVIYNGVDGPARVPERRSEGRPVIGCIGRISPEKGQREFVQVAARVHQALPQARFVIYGDAMFGDPAAQSYLEEVRNAAAGLPIEFRGWVHDVYDALAELDLLLVPSVGPEATTRVILEAFAAVVPVIAFDTGGISEVIENGVTGILTTSVEDMARESVTLLSGGRLPLACAARKSWEQRFTTEKFHQQLCAFLTL